VQTDIKAYFLRFLQGLHLFILSAIYIEEIKHLQKYGIKWEKKLTKEFLKMNYGKIVSNSNGQLQGAPYT
jgi:hypothetical protein